MCSVRKLILAAAFALLPCYAQRVSPEWKQGSIGLYGTWQQASHIVVGNLVGGKLVGATKPPSYASEAVRRIYWCEGELQITSYVRGAQVPTNRYLWGSIQPECRPDQLPAGRNPYTDPVIRVWFLRATDGYLRPIVESGGVHLLILRGQWPSTLREDPERYLARLLLNPYANSLNRADFALHFFGNASNACFVIGWDECKTEIRKISRDQSGAVRSAACSYLRTQFNENCRRVD
jgi:hypothetical protein